MMGLAQLEAANRRAAAIAANPAANALITRAVYQDHVENAAFDLIRALAEAMPKAKDYPADRVAYRAERKRITDAIRAVEAIQEAAEAQGDALRRAANKELAA